MKASLLRRRSLAPAIALTLAITSSAALAHAGEEHAEPAGTAAPVVAATAAQAGSPLAPHDRAAARMQADGSVFVPKATQYRMGLRTQRARREELAAAVELAGKVVAEPNAGGRVQSGQTGRIEPGPQGLPMLGQSVSKGQVLAWVRPSVASLDRANQQAALAALDAQLAIARSKASRYEQLEGAVPQKDIEAAQIEVKSLQARRASVGGGLVAREALRAPVSGVVSMVTVVAGQIVEPREVIAEIVDPERLAVEALAYDPELAAGIAAASAVLASGALELEFVGVGRQLRAQALPMLFRAKTRGVPLAIGQPLKIVARSARTHEGVALPLQALVRDRSGESVVWVHAAAERFEPRRVVFEALDADTVAVTRGLDGGERVVVAGAGLLVQVR